MNQKEKVSVLGKLMAEITAGFAMNNNIDLNDRFATLTAMFLTGIKALSDESKIPVQEFIDKFNKFAGNQMVNTK